MDKLKDFIDNNRNAFNDEYLPDGHFERFEQKLPAPRRKWVRLYSLFAFAAAACATLLILLNIPGGTPSPLKKQTASRPHKCEMKQEIEELRLYYNMQMNDVIAQMEELYKQQQKPGAEQLLEETRKILSDTYQFEEIVLPTLPCSNAGVFAMNQHYSTSLESLNYMLQQMEDMKQVKSNNR